MRTLPGPLFNAVLERGSLVTYKKGEIIWRPDKPSAEVDELHGGKQGFQRGVPCKASGICIIMAGLARTTYTLPGQASEVRAPSAAQTGTGPEQLVRKASPSDMTFPSRAGACLCTCKLYISQHALERCQYGCKDMKDGGWEHTRCG